jgi:hypothetical protein
MLKLADCVTPPPAPPLRERGADREQTLANVRHPSPGGEGPGVGSHGWQPNYLPAGAAPPCAPAGLLGSPT